MNYGTLDSTDKGLVAFTSLDLTKTIVGVTCTIELGSDEHLDMILEGITLEDNLRFI